MPKTTEQLEHESNGSCILFFSRARDMLARVPVAAQCEDGYYGGGAAHVHGDGEDDEMLALEMLTAKSRNGFL